MGTLNVILLLFVIQCGKNIIEKMSLINATAEWGLDGNSLWSYKSKGTNFMISPILLHMQSSLKQPLTGQEEFFPLWLTLTNRLTADSFATFAVNEISGHRVADWTESFSRNSHEIFLLVFLYLSNRCPRWPWKPGNIWSSRRWRDQRFTRPSRSSRVSKPGER